MLRLIALAVIAVLRLLVLAIARGGLVRSRLADRDSALQPTREIRAQDDGSRRRPEITGRAKTADRTADRRACGSARRWRRGGRGRRRGTGLRQQAGAGERSSRATHHQAHEQGEEPGTPCPARTAAPLTSHLLQRCRDRGIELGSGAPPDLRDRLGGGAPGPVRAIGADRVEGVRDEDYPAAERDVLALQAVGVSLAVPSLVRMANEPSDLGELVHGAQDLLADEGVLTHDVPLPVGQRPRL